MSNISAPRRQSSYEAAHPLPGSSAPDLAHQIVVTPEVERRGKRELPPSALRTAAAPLPEVEVEGEAQGDGAVIHSYSPFQKRRNERGSVQLDVISPAPTPEKKQNELSFFFDVENQNKPAWRKATDYVKSIFGDDEPHAQGAKEKKQNAKQQAIEQRTAKTFFANERTLLAWLNTATFLSLAGLTMINTQTSVGRVAGVGLTLVTIGFALYALWKYMQRLYGLKGKTTGARLDDKLGPPILIISFCVVLLTLGIYFSVNGEVSYVKP